MIHVYRDGHNRRVVFCDFLQNARDRVLEQELITESEFDGLTTELKEHLNHLRDQVTPAPRLRSDWPWLRQIQTKFFHAKQ